MALLLVGCAKEYDDSGLKERVSALETRVTALESNVQALQSAIGEGVFVAKVQEYADPDTGKTIGVTVTYTNGDVKYFQISPKDDVDAPVLGVIRSGSGALVWAIDGVAILVDGDEVPVYQTPVFTIDDDGNLWVEVDGKKTKLGQVQNEGATLVDGIFTDIKVEQDKVVLTLSDNTVVNIPFAEAFKIELMLDSCVYTAAEPIPVHYALTAATAGTVVRVGGYNPFEFSIVVNNEDKIIEITPLTPGAATQLLIVADSGIGLVSTATLLVEPEGLKVVDIPFSETVDYMAEGEGGTVTAHIVSNVNPEVKPVDEWIHLVDVKATAYTVTLSLDDNTTGEVRTGMVNILKKGTEEVLQTIIIGQLAAEKEEGPANLSKKESANSYLVYAPGEYKFKAVKGNSEESVGEVAKAEVLWETYNNDQEVVVGSVIASVAYADGFIVFATPETLLPGNAVIAAKDANDIILWSWHIWVPATEIVNNTYSLYSLPMMDRNLGALVAATATAEAPVESYGFLYQWGRKDPFPGPAAVSGSAFAKTSGPAPSQLSGDGATEACKITLEQSIQNPLLMGRMNNKGWITPANNELWLDESKTIYDPCPPGYRVPARDAEQPLHGSDFTAVTGWTESKDFHIFGMGDPVAVFPFAGYLDDYDPASGVAKNGLRALYWTAHKSDDETAYGMNVRETTSGGNAHKLGSAGKSRGASVRCVVVNEAAIVPPTPTEGGGEVVSSAIDLSAQGTANSYIVTAAGNYTFKTVKGNSEESVGTVASAEILWETENTETAPEAGSIIASVSYEEGYVTFSTPETLKAGNALIAVKDAEGTILWSWHIWIPASEIAIQDGTALCGAAAIMDRNLGALTATSMTGDPDPLSIGLNFQWGRKDPFPGMASFTSSVGAAVAGTAWTAKGEHITTAYSIAHPTEYAHIKEVDAGVWNVDDPKDLWNDENNKKTIYDPCPVGYRVPLYDSSLPMWKGSFGDDWVLDGEHYRFSYGDIVFPVGGYIDCWTPDYSKTGERTHIWASKWYDAERATCLYYRGDKENKYYSQKFHKAKAGSVRCVAE